MASLFLQATYELFYEHIHTSNLQIALQAGS